MNTSVSLHVEIRHSDKTFYEATFILRHMVAVVEDCGK
jgi:hypothetical protein